MPHSYTPLLKPTIISTIFFAIFFLKEPFISPLAQTLIHDPVMMGYVFSVLPLISIFFSPMIGIGADKLGRKRIISFGLACQLLACIAYYFSSQVWLLVAGKVLDALSLKAVGLIALAKIEDKIGTNAERGILAGIYLSITHIGMALSPLVGGYLTENFSLQLPFFVGIWLSFVLLLYALIFYQSNSHATYSIEVFSFIAPIRRYLSNRELLGLAIQGCAAHAVQPAISLFLPILIIQQLGLTYTSVGIAFFCHGLFNALQFIGGFLSDKIGSARTTYVGITLKLLAFLIVGFASSFNAVLLGVLIISLGSSIWNIAIWTHMSTIAQKERFQGEAMGAYMAIVKMAGFISFLAAGVLSIVVGVQNMYIIYSGLLVIGTLASIPYLHGPAKSKHSS
jgi:MFS family permease